MKKKGKTEQTFEKKKEEKEKEKKKKEEKKKLFRTLGQRQRKK